MGYPRGLTVFGQRLEQAVLGFINQFGLKVSNVVATGSDNTNAAALGGGMNVVTAGDATKGVILPTPTFIGQIVRVKNSAAAVLKVYPNSGAAINALTATTGALSMAAQTHADYVYTAADQWFSMPLLPS